MLTKVQGLIIRTVDMKEADRLITIFTKELGVITAIAKGARSLRSRQMSSTMQFCYGNYVLYQKGDFYWIKEAELIESFFDLRADIERLALAQYLCEVLGYITVEEEEENLLRLSLNSLFAIASGKYDISLVKAAFEIRASSIIGFMPDVMGCSSCGKKEGDFFLDIMDGSILCYDCNSERAENAPVFADDTERRIISLLSESARVAMMYCVHAPLERLFSFRIPDTDMNLFCRACEEYLIHHIERSFKTLDFYKEVKH